MSEPVSAIGTERSTTSNPVDYIKKYRERFQDVDFSAVINSIFNKGNEDGAAAITAYGSGDKPNSVFT